MAKLIKSLALVAGLLLVGNAAHAQNVLNYSQQGGSSWVVGGELQTGDGQSLKDMVLQAKLSDLSTVSNTAYVVSPVSGTLVGIRGVVAGAAASPTTQVLAYISNTLVTGGTTTLTSMTTVGKTSSVTPSAANSVLVGAVIKLESDGGSNVSGTLDVVLTIRRD